MSLKDTPEFQALIEELKDTDGALVPEIQKLTIAQHWFLGKSIVESPYFQKYNEEKTSLREIALARNVSRSTVYKETQFYLKYPAIELCPGEIDIDFIARQIPEGKHLSWSFISNKLLFTPRDMKDSKRFSIQTIINTYDLPKKAKELEAKFVIFYDDEKVELEAIEIR
jgi:hypothetical protein